MFQYLVTVEWDDGEISIADHFSTFSEALKSAVADLDAGYGEEESAVTIKRRKIEPYPPEITWVQLCKEPTTKE